MPGTPVGGLALFLLLFGKIKPPTSVQKQTEALVLLAVIIAVIILGVTAKIGSDGLIGGQMLDLQSGRRRFEAPELLEMYGRKTGSLFAAAIEMGARTAGVSDDYQNYYFFVQSVGRRPRPVGGMKSVRRIEFTMGAG